VTPDIILPDPFSYLESREKDLEYSLPWDQIGAQKYSKWNRHNYNLVTLKDKSSSRVKESPRFQKINKSVDFLMKRKNDTSIVLNLKQLQTEEAKNKKIVEEFKLEDEDKNLLVSSFEDSLKAHDNLKAIDTKKWKKDFEQRKDEWVKSLRQDVILTETMQIAQDMVKQVKK
jgi:carboxyl-terminal processing protease